MNGLLHADKNERHLGGQGRSNFRHAQQGCPGTPCRCDGPDYYFTEARVVVGTSAGGRPVHRTRKICEDKRLWINWAHCSAWIAYEGDDEPEAEVDPELYGFAAARSEFERRSKEVQRDYMRIIRRAGEPEEPIFDDEVGPLLDQINYALDCYHDAVVADLKRIRRREQVKP